jgi:hypothetical protein
LKQREIIVWISAFATFLAILSSVGMSVLLINEGASSIVRPYIIGDIIGSVAGDLSVEAYLWISVIVTFILIGITCIAAFHKPLDEKMLRMLVNVNGNLEDLRKTHEGTMTEMADQLEYNKKINQTFFMKVNSKVEEANKEMFSLLGGQGRAIK